MKTFFLVAIVAVSSAMAQQKENIIRIEFSSLTRGHQEYTIISPDTLKQTINSKAQARSLTKKDWEQLIRSLHSVSFGEIEGLKSPTMKRAHDGALHSTITIVTPSKSFIHTFDDENPHDKLKPLMKAIHSIRSKKATK